jgi:hypothetical protein
MEFTQTLSCINYTVEIQTSIASSAALIESVDPSTPTSIFENLEFK